MVADEAEVVGVAVPAAIAQAHHADAGLDEPPRDQQVVVAGRGAVILELVWLAVAIRLADFRILLRQVERLEKPATGQHVERPLPEGIHPLHDAAGVDVAAEAVNAREQAAAVGEPLEWDRLERHVLDVGAIGLEWREGRSEEAGHAGIGPRHVLCAGCEADEGGHRRVDRPAELGDARTDRGPSADRLEAILRPARHALKPGVARLASDHGADDRKLVHASRQLRKDLADLQARDVCVDRPKLAADLAGGIRLEVPHVLMGRTTGEEDVDQRFVPGPAAGLLGRRLLGPEEIGERQAAHAEGEPADREKLPTGGAVAHRPSATMAAVNREHRQRPRGELSGLKPKSTLGIGPVSMRFSGFVAVSCRKSSVASGFGDFATANAPLPDPSVRNGRCGGRLSEQSRVQTYVPG